MEKEISFIELNNPSLVLPDTSYGYSNEKLLGKQIDTESNREILRSQFYALTLQCTA